MKIGIANDHAGYELKLYLHAVLKKEAKLNELLDYGCHSNIPVDYPDYAKKVVEAINYNKISLGILICGSGIGMSMCANRNDKVRAALCYRYEVAIMSRKHNNANVLVLGARYLMLTQAKKIVFAFLATQFVGGRHINRINKI